MKIKMLYLPGFSHHLCGSRSRKAAVTLSSSAGQLGGLSEVGGRFLSPDVLSTGHGCRERVFSARMTFWTFLSQVLDRSCSCREAVRRVQAWYSGRGLSVPDGATGGYCQARQRLPLEVLRKAFASVGLWIKQRHRDAYLWLGHRVKVIDGTGMSMPDTEQNRRQWPYAGEQKPGCGFPVAQLVGLFCLGTGRLVKFALSPWKSHEISLARQLVGWVHKGEVLLADRGFCGWGLIALFARKGVPVVFRLHQARKDKPGISQWKKPQRPQTWERCLWNELPCELVVRIVHFQVEVPGFRTRRIALATTLLDTARYPDNELAALYMRRWRIELFFKDIKITLGLDILRCLTPQMVEKEIWMQAIAYNMVRALMLETAITHDVDIERLSFKGTIDTLRSWLPLLLPAKPRKNRLLIHQITLRIASDQVPFRPCRVEPRAKKRRPKNFQFMTKPRHFMIVSASRRKK
ncbi:IS4 family transposase [Opitutaceae bacterium TAV4]|nr:IS4 family transposase [Opitutaceae bacterium TAV4]RRK01596.1 IS4 family transposase [Opitutaceae bacterium TAV3]RRK01649.1 IS4 family transposase [Opitutaceae bacterium TAV3]RRK01677.1 IS4 family transposase [Opitutaceae bacterium TAV3]